MNEIAQLLPYRRQYFDLWPNRIAIEIRRGDRTCQDEGFGGDESAQPLSQHHQDGVQRQ